MSDVALALTSAGIGAVLGAMLGYLGTWLLQEQAKRSKKRLYLEILGNQLSSIAPPSPLDHRMVWLSAPITQVTIVRSILEGDILSPRADKELVQDLVTWLSWEAAFNDLNANINLAIVTESTTCENRQKWKSHLLRLHIDLYQYRNRILGELQKRGVPMVQEGTFSRPESSVY